MTGSLPYTYLPLRNNYSSPLKYNVPSQNLNYSRPYTAWSRPSRRMTCPPTLRCGRQSWERASPERNGRLRSTLPTSPLFPAICRRRILRSFLDGTGTLSPYTKSSRLPQPPVGSVVHLQVLTSMSGGSVIGYDPSGLRYLRPITLFMRNLCSHPRDCPSARLSSLTETLSPPFFSCRQLCNLSQFTGRQPLLLHCHYGYIQWTTSWEGRRCWHSTIIPMINIKFYGPFGFASPRPSLPLQAHPCPYPELSHVAMIPTSIDFISSIPCFPSRILLSFLFFSLSPSSLALHPSLSLPPPLFFFFFPFSFYLLFDIICTSLCHYWDMARAWLKAIATWPARGPLFLFWYISHVTVTLFLFLLVIFSTLTDKKGANKRNLLLENKEN